MRDRALDGRTGPRAASVLIGARRARGSDRAPHAFTNVRILSFVLLVSCGGNFAPPDPPPKSEPIETDANDPRVFEIETRTYGDAEKKMSDRCPKGYTVQRQETIEDPVPSNRAVGRGRTASPSSPTSHERVRFWCNAAE